jgi:large subunit ribosomal protein L25
LEDIMKTVKLTLIERVLGKKGVKAARKENYIPVEIYGKSLEKNISGSIARKEFVKALNSQMGTNVILELEHNGKIIKTIPHNLQIHPVKTMVMHADLLAVEDNEDVFVTVPVVRKGRSLAEIAGGRVFQVVKEIKVTCKPDLMPASIEVDIEKNEIGDRIKISELPYPEGVSPVFAQDTPVIVFNKGRGQSLSDEEAEEGAEETDATTAAEAEETPATE